jgi:ribosomal protein S18 acetylase RimI-like enzyme
MTAIRAYRLGDLDDLYRICLMTAAGGGDGTSLYRDPRLVGHVFAGPYARLRPEWILIAADDAGVGGYILGAPDTLGFEERLEVEWWPALRAAYPDPSGTPPAGWSADQRMSRLIHQPFRAPDDIVAAYPAHLHINLLPRLQGRGIGRRLMRRWLALAQEHGSPGVHLAVGSANRRAVRFYRARGFVEIERPLPRAEPMWFVVALPTGD